MRWEDEDYVKTYTRDTPEWLTVPLLSRCFFWELTRKCDRAGIIRLGKKGIAALAAAVHSNEAEVRPLLDPLLEDGCVVLKADHLVIPNYVEAQTARASDLLRKRQERQRDRDLAMTASRPVTHGHAESLGEERRGEEREDSAEPRTAPALLPVEKPSSPVLATLPCVGKGAKAYDVTEVQVAAWQRDFPAVDVLAEIRKARAWLEANPSKRKTAAGVPRFLVSWFGRVQDRNPNPRRNGSTNGRNSDPEILAALRDAERYAAGLEPLEPDAGDGEPSVGSEPLDPAQDGLATLSAALPSALRARVAARRGAGDAQDADRAEPGAGHGAVPAAGAVRLAGAHGG